MCLRALMLLAIAGCGVAEGEPPPRQATPHAAPSPIRYSESVGRLQRERESYAAELAKAPDPDRVLSQARTTLLTAIQHELLPAWSGTPWSMQGTASTPGLDEPIACGYFVATVLRDAGFSLNRVKFGQASALRIQKATTPPGVEVHRFFSIPPANLARKVAALGDGLYIIGLDVHVGFVVVEDEEAWLVHSSYTGDRVVTREPLATARAIANSQSHGYFVSELLTTDASVRKWVEGGRYVLPSSG